MGSLQHGGTHCCAHADRNQRADIIRDRYGYGHRYRDSYIDSNRRGLTHRYTYAEFNQYGCSHWYTYCDMNQHGHGNANSHFDADQHGHGDPYAYANGIAKWSGSVWSALGSGTNGTVNALVFDASGNLYVGGAFTSAGGNSASRICQVERQHLVRPRQWGEWYRQRSGL